MYIVKRTTEYPDGMRSEGYILKIGLFVEFTGRFELAKRYKTKTEAKADVKAARDRRCREAYEILDCGGAS